MKQTNRRLEFATLPDAIAEAESLLESGYTKTGNWTLAQICCHMRLTVESNMQGYPWWMTFFGFPLRPILRRFGLPKLMSGDAPKGLPTAGMFVPAQDLKDANEVDKFKRCVDTFLAHTEPLHSHPGFGGMSKDEFNRFHAAHAAHHLGFLIPNTHFG